MKAIILAAGRGRRMGLLSEERPKCLLPFLGRALLDWQLDALREAGVSEVGIVTGYRREQLARRVPTEFHNPRWAETNMVRSLQAAHTWLETEPCLVCYADLFYQASAPLALARMTVPLAITYDPDWLTLWSARFSDPLSDAETFRLSPDGSLVEIGGRPESLACVEGQYMGLLRIEPPGWAEMTRLIGLLPNADADRLQMTQLLQMTVDAGAIAVLAAPYRGRWAEYDAASDVRP